MRDTIIQLQKALGVTADGYWGPISQAAFEAAIKPQPEAGAHQVMASSFADPADIKAFKKCKAEGKTDQQCFKVGDNGVGKWGDPTNVGVPMCALPPEDWQPLGLKARGAKVEVKANGRTVICELRDTMPRKANVRNNCGVDLNPAACAVLGLKPPVMVKATWRWVEGI